MIVTFVDETEDRDLGFMDRETYPQRGELMQIVPMPVPQDGIPVGAKNYRVTDVVHMIGTVEEHKDAPLLQQVGVTVFVEPT